MRKLTTSIFYAILFLSSMLAQSSSAQVFVNGGALDLDGVFGIGSNTSYFVVDFGGTPESANTPRDSFAFGYQFDDPNSTAADGLLAIESASALEVGTTDFGGDLGLGLDSFTFGADTDTPDFGFDNRFFETFVGSLNNGQVDFTSSLFGISSIVLEDGDFIGFRANVSTYPEPSVSIAPRIPLVAIPEPSAVMLFGFAALAGSVKRRRKP